MAELKLNEITLTATSDGVSLDSEENTSFITKGKLSKIDLFSHILSHKYKENLALCDSLYYKASYATQISYSGFGTLSGSSMWGQVGIIPNSISPCSIKPKPLTKRQKLKKYIKKATLSKLIKKLI